MSSVIEYKCPCCGGRIEFDSNSQKMLCPFCGTSFDLETLKSYDEALNSDAQDNMEWESKPESQWQSGETDGMAVYICDSCGGEIIADKTLGSTSCPYCNNTVVMSGQFAGDLRPDYIIPFKLDKEAAKKALQNHMKGKPFLPKLFKSQNRINEIKGVYVPFWLFDADVNANIRYRATRVRTWSDSNYRYTETSYYLILRGGNISFQRVPVDGSTKMPDEIMESIEPFKFDDAVDFQTAYLSGYLADRYDVDSDQSIERANQRVKNSTESEFAKTVTGYSTVVPENTVINLSNGKAKYALYPVWMLNTSWNDKTFTFAMNGQTGKMVGDLPVDWASFWKWFGIITGIAGAVTFLILYLLWLL